MTFKVQTGLANMALFIIVCTVHVHSLFAQTHRFNMGFQSSVNITQIEGDNLRGFKNVGYSFGLLGGYNFNENNELILSGFYEKIGSDRGGAKTSRLTNKALAEIELQLISFHLAYSNKFGDSWDGVQRFRYTAGLKLNNILSQNSKLSTASVDNSPSLTDADFRKRYLSLRFGMGLLILKNTVLDFSYDHAIQSILSSGHDTPLTKLVPFYLGLSISYYIPTNK